MWNINLYKQSTKLNRFSTNVIKWCVQINRIFISFQTWHFLTSAFAVFLKKICFVRGSFSNLMQIYRDKVLGGGITVQGKRGAEYIVLVYSNSLFFSFVEMVSSCCSVGCTNRQTKGSNMSFTVNLYIVYHETSRMHTKSFELQHKIHTDILCF